MTKKYRSNENESSSPFLINVRNNDLSEDVEVNMVKQDTNVIHFYSDIDVQSCLTLNKNLREMDKKLRILNVNYGVDPRIELRLNTNGGEIFAAMSTIDTIRDIKTPVDSYVEGAVASAGTLISTCASRRYMYQNARLLIHQMSSEFGGTFAQFEDEMYNNNNIMKSLKDFYKKYTKIPAKKLEEILKRDIWLSATECLEYGIIDDIL
jgi:ATP-dependent Clp endopeptidase proteolytic subunit ClpP